VISSFLFSSCGVRFLRPVEAVGQVCSTCVPTRTRRISFPTHLIERVNFPSESTMSGKNTALQFLVAGLLLTINGAAGQPMCTESCDECSGCKCGENHFYCSICVENSQFGTGYHCEPAPTPRPTLYPTASPSPESNSAKGASRAWTYIQAHVVLSVVVASVIVFALFSASSIFLAKYGKCDSWKASRPSENTMTDALLRVNGDPDGQSSRTDGGGTPSSCKLMS
jgi:hypothetical protein